MAVKMYLHESYLSDGSLVYAVSLPQSPLDAVTLVDAMELVEKVKTAIAAHTNEEVEVVELSEVEQYGSAA